MQRQKTYKCGICKTVPDQLSHHKHHLETEKHHTKKELFKLQLEKLTEQTLQEQYNTTDFEVILEGIENITCDYKIIQTEIEKLKAEIPNDADNISTDNTQLNISMADIKEMQEQMNISITISNKDALRDKIHEIHNFLRNNGAGYGMNALKVFNVFYGLKKFELCNQEYIKKQIEKGIPQDKIVSLYKKYDFKEDYKFSKLVEMSKSEEDLADDYLKQYVIKDVLDGIYTSKLKPFLMYEIPRTNITARVYKYIIDEIDSITEIEKKCNVLLSGKIYEYFIGRDPTAISELGAFFTDRHIVNYIFEEKLKPHPDINGHIDEMIDMFGGSGGFTTGYIDYLNKHHSSSINWETEIKKIHHYDMNDDVIKSAWLEMFCLTGEIPTENNVQYRNSFTSEFEDKKYKLIVTNPPYGGDKTTETDTQIKQSKTKDYIKKLIPTLNDETAIAKLNVQLCEIEKEEKNCKDKLENAKVGLNIRGLNPRSSKRTNIYAQAHNLKGNDKEAVSLIMLMDMVADGGTVCGVLKEGVFFNKAYKDIRKCLIENFNVREVISVPQDQFENTSTKTSIIIFDNTPNTKTTTVKFSEMKVGHYDDDKFIMQNGFVYLVENKGDISRVFDEEVSSATREEILANPNCSLNGKDYNKQVIEPGEGFKLVKLGDIATIENGYAFKTAEYIDSGIPLLTIKHIPDFNLEGCNYIKENEKYKKFIIKKNDILMTMTGDNESVGRVGIYNMDNKIYCNQRVCKITIDNLIKRNYSYFIIQTLTKFIIGNGSIQKNISGDLIKKLDIPIPTTDQAIKQWVDKISKPFDEKNTKEQKLNTLELEIQNRIKEITDNEDCEEVELGSLFEYIKTGKNKTPDDKKGTLYPYYGTADITGYTDYYLFEGQHLLIARNGTMGNCFLVDKKFYPSDHIFVLKNKLNYKLIFLYYLIKSISHKINYLSNGSIIKGISKDALIKIKISIPKDKTLITALEPKFQEVETLQDDIKKAETLYKQYIDELAKSAIKQPLDQAQTINQQEIQVLDTNNNSSITKTSTTTVEQVKPVKPKKKLDITKKKSSKTSFNDILANPE